MKAKIYLTDKANGKFLEYIGTEEAPLYPAEVIEDTSLKYTDSEACMLNVHSDVEYQEILGVGGAFTETSAVNYKAMSDEKKNQVMDMLFSKEKGMGFNFCRTAINSCDFSIDDYTYVEEGDMDLSTFDISREKQAVIPMIKDAYKRGDIEIFASPWSAPSYMKTNGSNLAGYLKKDCYGLWAKYIKKYIEEMAKEGVNIWGITMQNEPRHAQTWESCNYTPEQENEFLGYIGKELEGTGKKILCYDHGRERVYERAKSTFESEFGSYCDGVANHIYSGDHYGEMKAMWYKYPDKLQVASEGCIGHPNPGYNDEVAVRHAETYIHDMIACFNGGTNIYLVWNLIVNEQSGPCHHRENRGLYVDAPVYSYDNGEKIIYDLFLYYMGHISKFVDKGAKVIATSTYTNRIDAVAFKNPDGKIVVVAANLTDNKMPLNVRLDKHLIKTSLEAHTVKTFVYED